MKKFKAYLIAFTLAGLMLLPAIVATAGNKDRSGQAGASELLINPWARGNGWGNANVASVRGLEGIWTNVAGTAFTPTTELIFSHTNWLSGSGVDINAFGFSQKVGEGGALSMAVMSMAFGEVDITTVDQPDGGIGTYTPSLMNINIAYAKAFSNSIYGGLNVKIISESIADISAQGIAIDAGIQYVTGAAENVKFGIALKNLGPTMRFSGDGLSFRGFIPGQESQFTVEQRSEDFEMPSALCIGAAYDFLFSEISRLTVAGNFQSNSFTKDQFMVGAEYAFKEVLMLRGGFTYEDGLFEDAERTSVYTGPSAGLTVQIPLNKETGSVFSVDYAYRTTNPFDGTHTIGARFSF
ncbi:MAG: PorV/PorQ family protein [Bacteroidales bacterium]|nr:PorV/PorQ family protein [Bacteroidales bacterium]